MSKEMIDFSDYKLWDKDDVKAVYGRALDEVKLQKDIHDRRLEAYHNDMATIWAPKIRKYFEEHKSIEATADKYGVDKEEVWDVIDENELKLAKDYLDVKEELFGDDDYDYEKFKKATSDILDKKNKSIRKNASARRVLGNEDLQKTIEEYFRKSTKGGRKTKKRGQKSKKSRKNVIAK